jgi:hypothetical protein
MNAGVPFSGTSNVAPSAGMEEIVQLDQNHPGFRDADYRSRRNHIAQQALRWRPGDPVPDVEYTDVEQSVWQTVWKNLSPLHGLHASAEYKGCSERVTFSRARIPQLREVNQKLAGTTGYTMVPVAGLVTSRAFLGNLRFDQFLSTQYIRHHTVPLYTPEPDIVHELVGHAATLADPGFAALNRAFGAPPGSERRVLKQIGRFTGTRWVRGDEGGRQAQGLRASLLNPSASWSASSARRSSFHDIAQMTARPYDPTV